MKKEEKKIQDFIQPLKHIVLSDTQAQDMRERLIAYADLHAVSADQATKGYTRSIFYSFSSFSRAGALALAVVLLLVAGTGVTFAAENSLPGDPLYAVKVNVAEPIQGVFITSTEGKATWENTLADRRLVEASTLAAENKLTPQTSTYLAQQVTDDADQSNGDAASLQASGNTDGALAVRSDLDARLSAHTALLALISPRLTSDGDATTSVAIANFLQRVDWVDMQVSQERIATEMALSGTASSSASTSISGSTSTSTSSNKHHAYRQASNTVTAYIDAQNTARVQEENSIFDAEARSLGVETSASSTPATDATTTPDDTATDTASSTVISSDQDGASLGTLLTPKKSHHFFRFP